MSADELDSLPDAQLDELFAVEVAGWQHRLATHANPVERMGMKLPNYFGPDIEAWWTDLDPCSTGVYGRPPKFCASADSVLPFLYKRHWVVNQTSKAEAPIQVKLDHEAGPRGESDTFPRSAVIAMLRARRAEKGAQP